MKLRMPTVGLPALLLILGLNSTVVWSAEEPCLQFSKGLQERGHADLAGAYVRRLLTRTDLSKPLRRLLDLERAQTERAPAAAADSWPKRWADAQQYWQEFSGQNSRDPLLLDVPLSWGALLFERGQRMLTQAAAQAGGDEKRTRLAEARAAFLQARPLLVQAVDQYRSRLDEAPSPDPAPPAAAAKPSSPQPADLARQALELAWVEATFQLAGLDFHLAQTYASPDDPDRVAALEQAAKNFDALYQLYRDFELGVKAHFWYARTLEEQGDAETALDVYDEVLAGDSEKVSATSEMGMIYAQAELARLRMIQSNEGDIEAAKEAQDWLAAHRSWRNTATYQGIALEGAKAQLAYANGARASQKAKLLKDAIAALNEISQVDSPYRLEAIRLTREHLSSAPDLGQSGFEGQVLLGDVALQGGQWLEAVQAYSAALQASDEKTDPQQVGAIRLRLNQARLRVAVGFYEKGKLEESIRAAGVIAREDVSDPSAAAASKLAVYAALALYEAAPDAQKPAAYERLQKIVDFLVQKWPGGAEADDARLALGQAAMTRGDVAQALNYYQQVKPNSARYPAAANAIGRAFWKQYSEEKQKPDDQRSNERVVEYRQKAYESLQAAVSITPPPPSDPLHQSWLQAHVILGEMALENKQPEEAIKLLDPVADPLAAAAGERLGELDWRVLVVTLRARQIAGQLERASDLAAVLLRAGPDSTLVNTIVVELCRQIAAKIPPITSAATGSLQAMSATSDNAAMADSMALSQILRSLMVPLAAREQLTASALVFVAEQCSNLGLDEEARRVCDRILTKAEQDPQFRQAVDKSLTRVRLQLVGLLRRKGQFDAAAKTADELIQSHPNALEPLLEKGRILQAWAEKDPQRYEDCVAHWTRVRLLLARVQPRPAEYYDAVYNAAAALVAQGRLKKDASKAQQAEKLLKSTLALDPDLNGPETVARFHALLKTATAPASP
jgi:tetratricopeptide (TPR) repeat protein